LLYNDTLTRTSRRWSWAISLGTCDKLHNPFQIFSFAAASLEKWNRQLSDKWQL